MDTTALRQLLTKYNSALMRGDTEMGAWDTDYGLLHGYGVYLMPDVVLIRVEGYDQPSRVLLKLEGPTTYRRVWQFTRSEVQVNTLLNEIDEWVAKLPNEYEDTFMLQSLQGVFYEA